MQPPPRITDLSGTPGIDWHSQSEPSPTGLSGILVETSWQRLDGESSTSGCQEFEAPDLMSADEVRELARIVDFDPTIRLIGTAEKRYLGVPVLTVTVELLAADHVRDCATHLTMPGVEIDCAEASLRPLLTFAPGLMRRWAADALKDAVVRLENEDK